MALELAPAVTGALTGFSMGTIQTAYANAIFGRPWYEGVTQSGLVGAAGGMAAGYVMGKVMLRLPSKGAAALVSRMAMGGLVGGGVSGGTQVAINVATGRPWDEGLGQAIGVGWTTGSLGAFMDYYGGRLMDRQLGRRPVRSLAEDADVRPSRPGFWERVRRWLADERGYFAPWLDTEDATAARLRNLDEFTGEPTGLSGDDLRRALSEAGGGRGGLGRRMAEAQPGELPARQVGEVGDAARRTPGVAIELGPGGKGNLENIAEARPDMRVIGIDYDPDAVRLGQAQIQGSPYANRIELLQGNYLKDPDLPMGDVVIAVAPGPRAGDSVGDIEWARLAAEGAAMRVSERGQIYIVSDLLTSKADARWAAKGAVERLSERGLKPRPGGVRIEKVPAADVAAGRNPLGIPLESPHLVQGDEYWAIYIDLR